MCHADAVATQQRGGFSRTEIRTLGIDLAKSVLKLHGVDADGAVILQTKLLQGAVLSFPSITVALSLDI
jgi:hypothetical protein